jgi:hypothetical protein
MEVTKFPLVQILRLEETRIPCGNMSSVVETASHAKNYRDFFADIFLLFSRPGGV